MTQAPESVLHTHGPGVPCEDWRAVRVAFQAYMEALGRSPQYESEIWTAHEKWKKASAWARFCCPNGGPNKQDATRKRATY